MAMAVNNIPVKTFFLITTVGAALTLLVNKNKYSIILINYLAFISIIIFMNGIPVLMTRLMIMTQWLFYLFFFAALTYVYEIIHRRVIRTKPVISRTDINPSNALFPLSHFGYIGDKLLLPIKILFSAMLFFFLISGAHLLHLNYFKPLKNKEMTRDLTFDEKKEIVKRIDMYCGEVVNCNEYMNNHTLSKQDRSGFKELHQGKLIVYRGRIGKYMYYLKKGERIRHWSRLFYPRKYERTVIRTENNNLLLFPGMVSNHLAGKDVILAGVLNIDSKHVYEGKTIIECIAIIPIRLWDNSPDFDKMIITQNDEHRKILEKLTMNKQKAS
jgi:hypothetical protein